MLAETRVTLAEVLLSSGDRAGARQRMDRDERLQLAGDLARRPESEPRGELVLDQSQAGLLQPYAVGEDPGGRTRGGQDLGAEQRESRPAGGRSRSGVARSQLRGARVGEPQRLQRVLLAAADRWFMASGAGDGAALASCLLATLRAEDGDADAEHALQAIHTAALIAGDEHVQTLALDALAAVRR
jgi:hypothetical protein